MGCTQASNVNRIQIAPLGQDSESIRQFYQLQQEQRELQQSYDRRGSDPGGNPDAAGSGASSAERLVRQDWARLKQTLAPKNSIQLISCEALQPLLAKAVGNDAELREKVIRLFLKQTKAPKSQIHARFREQTGAAAGDQTSKPGGESTGTGGKETDEVDYCLKIA